MKGFVASDLPGGGRLWRPARPSYCRSGLLLVHGAYHGAWCWQDWADRWNAQGVPVAAIDLPGRPSLPSAASLVNLDVADMSRSVAAAAQICAQPLIGVGHSLGALVLAKAAEAHAFDGLILLAPSPPGNLEGARPVVAKPSDTPVAPPDIETYERLYLGGLVDTAGWHRRLCAESPAALNDRYRLKVSVRPQLAPYGVVVEAGREERTRHPDGQDAAVARHFAFEHVLLPEAAHCMMHQATGGRAFDTVNRWVSESADIQAQAIAK